VKANNINFTALDIGSSKISILAAQLYASGDARIGYQGLFHSSGIKAGVIKDYRQAEASIVNAIYTLENEIERSINTVSISLSGIGIKSFYIYQKVRLLSGKVSKGDVQVLHENALEQFSSSGQTVIHYFPIEYTLDKNNSILNPVGMFGDILGCRLHVITADSSQITNILNCFAKCNISIKEIVVGVYASSLAVLTEDEKSLGSVVIDFGSSTTSFAIFVSGELVYTGFIPFGGDNITSDIARILSISIPAAEKLKVLYGSAMGGGADDGVINLSEIETSGNYDDELQITASDLSMIISARVEEIVELVKAEYDKVGIDHLIARRVILTGGGSLLRGMKEIVANNFKKQVRIGNPLNIPGFVYDHSTPSYCSSIGLIKYEMIKQKKHSGFVQTSTNFFEKITSWLKDGS